MRLTRFQVVAVTLACLLFSASAEAQFGKLKSLAKEKLGLQAKINKAAPSAAAQSKTTLAPGGKSLDVSRQDDATSEAKVDSNPKHTSKPGISIPSKTTSAAKRPQPLKSSQPHK